MTDIDNSDSESHKALGKAYSKAGVKTVQKLKQSRAGFINPFQVEKESLVCLSSGRKVEEDVASDLLSLESKGNAAFEESVEHRLVRHEKSFHDPIKKIKLKTYCSLEVILKSQTKEMKLKNERNVLVIFFYLAEQHNLSLEKVMQYPLN